MCVLSDATLLQRIKHPDDMYRIGIDPFDESAIQPASIDLRLGDEMLYYRDIPAIINDYGFLLPPHGTVLVSTLEYIHVPVDCVCRVEGKSSIGRQFVVVHCTAGWCDPGWHGNITLEIVNHSNKFFLMEPHMRICQVTFLLLDKPAQKPYSGKYQADTGPRAHKSSKDG